MNSRLSKGGKLGILGGGQLGKMLLQATSSWDIHSVVLDPNEDCPASHLCDQFVKGNFDQYEDVYSFGQEVDILTIEIENVNADALKDLEKLGKIIHPSPKTIQLVQDKKAQKDFYQKTGLPTASYKAYESADRIRRDIEDGELTLPFVQKSRRAGYDGKGVQVIKKKTQLQHLFDVPSIVEDLVPVHKELSVIVARNARGEIEAFPPVEMEFNPNANLVEYLFAPAEITKKVAAKAEQVAVELIEALGMQGVLAVELFLTKEKEILINEVAPRPHNSGHHTIEANFTSQYEQHLRALLDMPLGSTAQILPAVMVNILGEPGHTGEANVEGMKKALKIPGANIHLYGKKDTKPYRKMGHVTVLDTSLKNAKKKAKKVKKTLKVTSKS